MKYTLKSFSQDVNLNKPGESQNFLVFDREDGTEFRIPVPQETIVALTWSTLAYEAKNGKKAKEATEEELEEIIEELKDDEEIEHEPESDPDDYFEDDSNDDLGDASVFGEGDNLEDLEPVVERPVLKPVAPKKQRTSAVSEDEVPSL